MQPAGVAKAAAGQGDPAGRTRTRLCCCWGEVFVHSWPLCKYISRGDLLRVALS